MSFLRSFGMKYEIISTADEDSHMRKMPGPRAAGVIQ